MNYIDNSDLFKTMPEKKVFSQNSKIWIGALSVGLGGATILAAIYLSKYYKKENAGRMLNSLEQDNSSPSTPG